MADLERLEMPVRTRSASVRVEDDGSVVFWAVAVDKSRRPNRKGFVFDWATPEDVDVSALRENPVLLYMHDDRALPVGRIEEIVVTNRSVRMRCRIPGGPGYESLEPIRRWVADGYLRAVSIGFYARDVEEIPPSRDGESPALRVRRFEIVELSLVSIGAHPTALIQAADEPVQQGMPAGAHWETAIDQDGGRLYRLALSAEDGPMGADTQAGAGQADIAVDAADAPATQAPERWKAIPYDRHGDCPLADEDTPWDGAQVVRDASVDDLMLVCALEDADNPDVKAGYKLPHHLPGGERPRVVWRGVAAAMAVLFGARGGVKGVGEDARRGAYKHLARHYEQFGREAPEYQEYSTEDLERMYDQGIVVIPGREQEQAVAPLVVNAPGLDDRLAALEQELRAVRRSLEAAERAQQPAETAPATVTMPSPAREVPPEMLDALRNAVRAYLRDSDVVRRCLEQAADDAIQRIRRGRR